MPVIRTNMITNLNPFVNGTPVSLLRRNTFTLQAKRVEVLGFS
jgi:hypothetical protein